MLNRLITSWVYGGFLAGILLLFLTPGLSRGWPPALTAIFLLLPAYMLHQYEEHDNDRFRTFFNRTLGQGRELLSPWAVFLINIPGVWGVIALSFLLAATVQIGFGLIAVYLVLVNTLTHLIAALILRGYNSGLGTALLLFLPLGVDALVQIQQAGGGSFVLHLLGLAAAVGIHLLILLYVRAQKTAVPRRTRNTAVIFSNG